MDKYLTEKARPGRMKRLAENAVALLLTALLFAWGFIAVMGFLLDGFMPLAHLLMLFAAIPFILLLSAILERKRARIHARSIVSALSVTENGALPFDQLAQVTRINKLEKTINLLTAKGYIRDVKLVRDEVRLGEALQRQAVCAYCGPALPSGRNGLISAPVAAPPISNTDLPGG